MGIWYYMNGEFKQLLMGKHGNYTHLFQWAAHHRPFIGSVLHADLGKTNTCLCDTGDFERYEVEFLVLNSDQRYQRYIQLAFEGWFPMCDSSPGGPVGYFLINTWTISTQFFRRKWGNPRQPL